MQPNNTIFIVLLFSIVSCKEKELEPQLEKIYICALDEMLNDINFNQEWLTIGTNYFSWVPDGYMQYDSVNMGKGNIAWSDLEDEDIDVECLIMVLNGKFPKGHKLVLIPQEENEKKFRFEKKILLLVFGGMKRNKNKFIFKGGFARSSRVGSGVLFIERRVIIQENEIACKDLNVNLIEIGNLTDSKSKYYLVSISLYKDSIVLGRTRKIVLNKDDIYVPESDPDLSESFTFLKRDGKYYLNSHTINFQID